MAGFLTLLLIISALLSAKDLGTYGETFSIQEEDFRIVLQERLTKTQLDQNRIQEVFLKTINEPKGKTFPRAKQQRSFEFDPSICLQENIIDHHGSVTIEKGTKYNPLEKSSLDEDLLFFDGNDPEQLTWAKNLKGIWVLTNGKPLELEMKEKRAVYFDQAGYLTNKLGIKCLPAKVSQKDKKLLYVEEIPCI